MKCMYRRHGRLADNLDKATMKSCAIWLLCLAIGISRSTCRRMQQGRVHMLFGRSRCKSSLGRPLCTTLPSSVTLDKLDYLAYPTGNSCSSLSSPTLAAHQFLFNSNSFSINWLGAERDRDRSCGMKQLKMVPLTRARLCPFNSAADVVSIIIFKELHQRK